LLFLVIFCQLVHKIGSMEWIVHAPQHYFCGSESDSPNY
jgi:hypothetical protein